MKNFIALSLICALIICVNLKIEGLLSEPSSKERIFFIKEKILFKGFPKDISNLRIWIPYPPKEDCQAIEDFKLESPFSCGIITDRKYGNKMIYLCANQFDTSSSNLNITLSMKVKRRECGISKQKLPSAKELKRFLRADRTVPVNGDIKKLANKITYGKTGDLEKVRAIYDYIIDELNYSKDDPRVCGIGDSLLTLKHKKGICTDYHSLFISLVRSLGIPAKFEIGFPISDRLEEGRLNGYHCWAKFYIRDRGWIPVDISEADKHPEKRDYFFGRIDENRIHLTTGRDIFLKYAKNSQPLNFFVYPYAELNGLRFDDMDFEISFKDLTKEVMKD